MLSGRGPNAVHLDYLSCLLTVVSTVMVSRKHWMGLVIASINSMIICAIGLHTGQYGLILANLFCITAYAYSVKSWRRDRKPALVSAAPRLARAAATRPRLPNRASLPPQRVPSGLFLAYRASSQARVEPQATGCELQAANGLMNSGSAAGVNLGS